MTTEVPTWGDKPKGDCPDGTCAACQVKEAGGRAVAAFIGEDYDALAPGEQGNLRHLAQHVYQDMNAAIRYYLPSSTQVTLTGDQIVGDPVVVIDGQRAEVVLT